MHEKCAKSSLSEKRFRPYPTERPRNDSSDYFYNATWARLMSLSENNFTLFKSANSGNYVDPLFPSEKNDCREANKRVQFNITPDFLEPKNHEYLKDNYFYHSSSGISSSAQKSSKKTQNSILKRSNTPDQKKRWLCSICLGYNAQDQEKCYLCKNFKSKLDTNCSRTSSFAGLTNLDLNKRTQPSRWNCCHCCYANCDSDYCCKNCGSSKANPNNEIIGRKELSCGKRLFNELLSANNKENISTSLRQAKKIAKPFVCQPNNMPSGYLYSAKDSPNIMPNSILNTKEHNKRWICSLCSSYNAQDQKICLMCKDFKRLNLNEFDSNYLKTSSFAGLQNSILNTRKELSISWKCVECSFVNNNLNKYCKNCRSAKTNHVNNINETKDPFSLAKYWNEEKKYFNELLSKNNKENIESLNDTMNITKPIQNHELTF